MNTNTEPVLTQAKFDEALAALDGLPEWILEAILTHHISCKVCFDSRALKLLARFPNGSSFYEYRSDLLEKQKTLLMKEDRK